MLVRKLKSGLIEIFNRDFDVGGEGNEFYDDDIYIMMKCLSRKMSTFLKGPRSVCNVLSSLP